MILIGLAAGVMTGFTGASGVMIVVPLVNLLLSFTLHESIGTSLMADVIASIGVSYTYYRYGHTDLKAGLYIAIGSIIGALLSSQFVVNVHGNNLGVLYGAFLLLTGGLIWRKGFNREDLADKLRTKNLFKSRLSRVTASLFMGFIIGNFTGFLGAGGGFMIFFILILVLNFSLHRAIGTSTLIMIITASSGTAGYLSHGNVNIPAGLIIGACALGGGILSSIYANRISEKALSRVIGISYFCLGGIMVAVRIIH